MAARAAKAAKDALPPGAEVDDPEPVTKAAMDAAIATAATLAEQRTVARMNAIFDAKAAVRPYIGDVIAAMDSAEAVYKLALDHLKVDLSDAPASAYRAILRAQPVPGSEPRKPRLAQDAAGAADLDKRFPGASRLKHV